MRKKVSPNQVEIKKKRKTIYIHNSRFNDIINDVLPHMSHHQYVAC